MTPETRVEEAQAIKTFILERLLTGQVRNQMTYGIDVSAPVWDDMQAINRGEFDVRSVQVSPSPEGDNFHCYVGRTEIHFMKQAAADIRRILEQQRTAE